MNIDKINLVIDEKARSYARIYASLISDAFQRKRANAAITALFAYAGMLKKSTDVNIQNSMTLYRNPTLCEQYEIADFYVNNYHIDVRVTVDSDTALLPRVHYENLITPDFYIVIKVDSNLKTAQFIGAVDTAAVQPEPFDFHYYKVSSSAFISNEEFLKRIQSEKVYNFNVDEHELFKNNYLSFIDNEISKQRKNEILKHLFKCSECRTEFCCFTGFEMVNCNINKYPEILIDQTLYLIGAQSVDDIRYQGKEEKIYIGKKKEQEKQVELNEKQDSIEYNNQEQKETEEVKEQIEQIEEPIEGKEEEQKVEKVEAEEKEKELPLIEGEYTQPLPTEEYKIKDETMMDFVPYSDDIPPEQINTTDDDENKIENDSMALMGSVDDIYKEDFDNLFEENKEENKKDESGYFSEDITNSTIVAEEQPDKTDDISDFIMENNEPDLHQESVDVSDKVETSTTVEELNVSEEPNVQKVIVDYDEFGEPIYSYIAGANGTEPASDVEISQDSFEDINQEEQLISKIEDNIHSSSTSDELVGSLDDSIFAETVLDSQDVNQDMNIDNNELQETQIDLNEENQFVLDDNSLIEEEVQEQAIDDNDITLEETKSEEKTLDEELSEIFDFDDLTDETISENTEEAETANEIIASDDEEINESNILDYMFVDGALEREAQEQQAVSYAPLGAPVDSFIPAPINNDAKEPDSLHVEEKDNENEEEIVKITDEEDKTSEEENSSEEIDESEEIIEDFPSENEDETDLNSKIGNLTLNSDLADEIENIKDTEEFEQLEENNIISIEDLNEEKNSEEFEIENINTDNMYNSDADFDNSENNAAAENFEIDNNDDIQYANEENPQSENIENEITSFSSGNNSEEQTEEKNEDDELLSVLPTEQESSPVQMFDGYIESEILKNEDDDDDEEDEEYDDDDEDEDEGDDEMSDEDNAKKSSIKKLMIMSSIIISLIIIFALGALFFLKNRETSSNEATIVQAQPFTEDITSEQANDMFDAPIENSNIEIPVGNDAENKTASQEENKSGDINIGDNSEQKTNNANNEEKESNALGQVSTVKTLTEKDLTPKQNSNGDINKAITNALSAGENLVTLRGVNWSCASELFTDRAFKVYMQNIDNNLKQNLKNNIMGVTEIPPKNQVTVKFAVDNQRNLRKVLITESSNSEEVDKIVLRSINETFEGEKSPILTDSPLKADMYYFQVVIKL